MKLPQRRQVAAGPAPERLAKTFSFIWHEPRQCLWWRWIASVRLTLVVRAEPIEELLAVQAMLVELEKRHGGLTDGMIAAAITADARALRLPPTAHRQLWDAYAELNHLPKAEGEAGGTEQPSSTSPSSSSEPPSPSPESGSSA